MSEIKDSQQSSQQGVFSAQEASLGQDKLDLLKDIRKNNHFSESGIWSNQRLEAAVAGLGFYKEIYDQASSDLKKYLAYSFVIQVFTGVRPTLNVAHVVGKKLTDTIAPGTTRADIWDEEDLILKTKEELSKLLEEKTNNSIRLTKLDLRKIKLMGDITPFKYTLVNEIALKNVAQENPDLFPANIPNYSDWLIENPGYWPMFPTEFNDEAKINEIRSGIVSGFPREAVEKYSAISAANIDWLKSLFKFNLVKKTHFPRLKNKEVNNAETESGLFYVHYSENDLTWTREAAALMNHCLEIFKLPLPKLITSNP